ncbi:T9SS type A sorting domain-containing protein [Chryseobacterium luquanense]|uniref:T9SS type A sorting domain-containing protein n=1 Tax=Chryseobacterium luquanense TaxID=2983766 RepID=A0ABT3XYH8_9FLAO|nr:T9SS type A sorting domain-containing protein [Chryseobacterium luquanense]MCX8530946.1 T9SS type A sorting domain-containing protein [Chryseobacterium luquanense]
MKFKLFFFLILIINFNKIWSQSPSIQWQKSLGGSFSDYGKSIRQTQDGGFILAGSTQSNNGDVTGHQGSFDCWIVKLNISGNIQWQKTYGGSGSDGANSIEQTQDGGYIFAGYTSSNNGDVTGNHSSSDYWVVKLDPSGNIQWQKSLGGYGYEEATSVQETSDGGYIVAGNSMSTDTMGDVMGNHGFYDYWVVKLNSSGNIQWQKNFGGSSYEYAGSIKQTLDNGYIMAGSTISNNGDVSQNFGPRDYWVIKLDAFGNLQWEKSLGGTGGDEAFDVIQNQDGDYIVSGYAQSDGPVPDSIGSRDFWIVKLNPIGNVIWQKNFGGTALDGASSIYQTSDGGYIVGGYTQSTNGDITQNFGNTDYWIIKLDSAGNLQWQKSLGGSNVDQLYAVQQTSDNGYIMIGNTTSSNGNITLNHGSVDIWVVRLGSTLGVDDYKNILKPSIYPNPAKDFVNINNLPKESTVSITDLSGRKLFSNKYNDEKVTIYLPNLINGVYLIKAENKGTTILSEKLIIKK